MILLIFFLHLVSHLCKLTISVSMNITEVKKRAEDLKTEKMSDSITPERLGSILTDTLACMESLVLPQFDLLKSRSRKYLYQSGDKMLSDYGLCLRFRGHAPDNAIIELYRYENRHKQRFKKIHSAMCQECEVPSEWIGGGYQTIVYPLSLMRIFWCLFDPLPNSGERFHSYDYDAATTASSWLSKCNSGSPVLKWPGKDCEKRPYGALFSGTFGLRVVTDSGAGNMMTFGIFLYENENKLSFALKIDKGITKVTY